MRVVSARVHLARNFTAERFAGAFGKRQSIHVGAQPRDAAGTCAAHDTDDARFSDTAMFDTERLEFAFDDRRRAFFLESEFRKAMDLAPDGDGAFDNGRIDRRRHLNVA